MTLRVLGATTHYRHLCGLSIVPEIPLLYEVIDAEFYIENFPAPELDHIDTPIGARRIQVRELNTPLVTFIYKAEMAHTQFRLT